MVDDICYLYLAWESVTTYVYFFNFVVIWKLQITKVTKCNLQQADYVEMKELLAGLKFLVLWTLMMLKGIFQNEEIQN